MQMAPVGPRWLMSSASDQIASKPERSPASIFAETWNGRLAMLGFVIGLGTELLTGQSILGQIGLG